MGVTAYYNEFDPFAASWLRNLIKEGLIPDGDVDERSIADVDAADLRSFDQCHFFAGIGGWSYALRLAGWPEDRPVWTGSCPCQPFSVAGRGKGTDDERHLWPVFARLIAECRPSTVFGEQVASRAGREWLAGVRSDLEGVGYAVGGADLCAAGVGAPHIRQRLYWAAKSMDDTASARRGVGGRESMGASRNDAWGTGFERRSSNGGALADAISGGLSGNYWRGAIQQFENRDSGSNMADADSELRDGCRHIGPRGRDEHPDSRGSGDMADADDEGREGRQLLPECADELSPWSRGVEWRRGADGKARRVKPGIRLLANGVSNRVGRLRGYGNAIVPQVAAEFISAAVREF